MERNNIKILLVEDDEDDFILTREMLSECKLWKADLEWVSSYDEALELFTRDQHDVYLFDYRLGERTGLELLSEVVDKGCKAPVIILTGQDDQEIDVEAISAGAADYLVKGQINSTLLDRSIRHAIEHKRAEEELKSARDYAENIINSSIDMIVATDMAGKIIEFNPAAHKVFGYSDTEIFGKEVEILYADTFEGHRIRNIIHREKVFSGEIMSKKKNGKVFPSYISASILKNLESIEVGTMSIIRDITDQKRLEQQLLHNAFHDALTGLPNRDLFVDRLNSVMKRAKRHSNYMFAIFFIDIDRFKVINDSLGHVTGDQLLIAIAEKLGTCLRANDTLARFGGDEFTILLDDINKETSARLIADRILKSLESPFNLNGHSIFTSASIGIVLSMGDHEQPEDLLRDADTAMYRAKSEGKNRYAVFDKNMHAQIINLLKLEADLRCAVERKEFLVHYQPVVSLTTGKMDGFEALIRWQHPESGMISPSEFIPLAEETKLIEPIGKWVLYQACMQIKMWQEEGFSNLCVAVNVSACQFKHSNFPDLLMQVLKDVGIDPHYFEMEITESITMENSEYSIMMLKKLSSMGIRISMDDFGTGYSAINYLKQFPINTIKIDRSLVRDVAVHPESAAIARAIITMAHSLNMKVIAEGVETEEQLNFLQLEECDKIQGYLFSRPVSAEEIGKILKEGRCLSPYSKRDHR